MKRIGPRRQDGNLRDEVNRLMIEQSISSAWVLIYLNALLAVFFGIVYLTSLRDPAVVFAVLWPRLLASAIAAMLVLYMVLQGREWAWQNRRRAILLLAAHETVILLTFGVTATFWMSEQDYSINALSVTGISAFGIISGILAPRHRVSLLVGRLGLFLPLIWFCLSTQPPFWGLLAALCVLALLASYGVAFAVHGQQLRQALLATRLRRARQSTARALRAERAIRAELEAENALRERFLHAVTHDLGQPLQALNFHLRRLGHAGAESPDRETGTRIAQFVDVAKVCLVSANGIIDSVAGSAWLNRELGPAVCPPMPLAPLFAAVAAEVEPLAEHHNLTLTVAPSSLWVMADAELLERILRNLVRNAVQHSERRILIGARPRGKDWVELLVQDDGPGVPADMQKTIFQPFEQVRMAKRRGGGNVGLGLSIVEELTAHMGGRVALDSVESHGSRFSVFLQRAEPVEIADQSGKDLSVLIIDDDAAQRDATAEAVLASGGAFSLYDQPFQADAIIAAIRAHDQTVLLDYHLGGRLTADIVLDGLDARARADVHIVTSDQSPDLMHRLQAYNVQMVLKPVRADQITAILDARRRPPLRSGSTRQGGEKPRSDVI